MAAASPGRRRQQGAYCRRGTAPPAPLGRRAGRMWRSRACSVAATRLRLPEPMAGLRAMSRFRAAEAASRFCRPLRAGASLRSQTTIIKLCVSQREACAFRRRRSEPCVPCGADGTAMLLHHGSGSRAETSIVLQRCFPQRPSS